MACRPCWILASTDCVSELRETPRCCARSVIDEPCLSATCPSLTLIPSCCEIPARVPFRLGVGAGLVIVVGVVLDPRLQAAVGRPPVTAETA